MVVVGGVDQVLQRAVDAGQVPGVVALAANDAGVIYAGAFGQRELGKDSEMRLDTPMWVASMTKAVTSVAAMQLVEQGALSLDEPLSARVPELGAVQVLDGFDANNVPRLRAARRPITLRHLLSHTAGFVYDIWNADMLRYQQLAEIPGGSERTHATFRLPLAFDPGDRWEYGINTDWVGLAVERVSGQSLEAYFHEHIFDPLGMVDSGFVLGPERRARLAAMHMRQPDGSLSAIPTGVPKEPEFFLGGGGLHSTGPDYLSFLRMLLGGGQLGQARLLRPETVAEMGKNQIGELTVGLLKTCIPRSSNDAEFFPGMVKKWGLGYMISTEVAPTGRGAGSLAWGGLANTYYWIDPTRRLTGVIMTQILPFADPLVLNLFEQFEKAIYTQ